MIKQSRPTILLTRPALQSQRFAAELAGDGLGEQVLIAPLFATRYLPSPAPNPAAVAVMFTSETGVAAAQAAGYSGRGQTAFCVGSRTARAAAEAGYHAHDAQGDWRDLAAMVQSQPPRGPLVLFCAQDAPHHLETALTAQGFTIQRLPVYAQDVIDFSSEARAVLAQDGPVILPVFSARSAQVLAQKVQGARAQLWVSAISAASLAAFDAPHARAIVADRPNAAAMRDIISKLLQ